MTPEWLGSPNFSPNRDGHDVAQPPSWIVLHTMVGALAAANARFQDGDPNQVRGRASAHYGVCLDGRVVQWVKESDAAWHSGSYDVNPGSNLDSIGIEHEDNGDYNGPRTDALYLSSAQLVAAIAARYPASFPVPLDRTHVIKHREVAGAATACPDALDVDRIVRMANDILGGKMPDTPTLPASWRTEDLGGKFTQIATPVVLADGSLHIFGVGVDGHLWHWIYKA
jgi:N-acetylmuramoyl-L-alanine amidase CwlA